MKKIIMLHIPDPGHDNNEQITEKIQRIFLAIQIFKVDLIKLTNFTSHFIVYKNNNANIWIIRNK